MFELQSLLVEEHHGILQLEEILLGVVPGKSFGQVGLGEDVAITIHRVRHLNRENSSENSFRCKGKLKDRNSKK